MGEKKNYKFEKIISHTWLLKKNPRIRNLIDLVLKVI
tara:strand:- start:123 stop:233 length:111 start_codon:yes stop_codon:yes gene_type:complete